MERLKNSNCQPKRTTLGIPIKEGQIYYHADNVLIHVPLDDAGRTIVRDAVKKARELKQSTYRLPVTDNERLCTRCLLAPVCLPEEARLAHNREWQPIQLFPEDDNRQIIHILELGTCVGRTGEQIKITRRNQPIETIPARQVGQLVPHSFSQISTPALHFCGEQGIGVHFISGGGRYLGSFDSPQGSIQQRRIRQYAALSSPDTCLELARKLMVCRGQGQRKFLMRGTRGKSEVPESLEKAIAQMKAVLKQVPQAKSLESLLGLEGNLARLLLIRLSHHCVASIPIYNRPNT